jgi:hypothetical protein
MAMEELYFVYGTALIIVLYFIHQAVSGKFDPFAPIWLFMIGYLQVYVLQAVSFHSWAIGVRGKELVTAANFRSFWALIWFLLVYQFSPAPAAARILPYPPRNWSPLFAGIISPPLILWGLYCANMLVRGELSTAESYASEDALVRSFPFMMLVAAVLLLITGRTMESSRPLFLAAGLLAGTAYVLIWMFNGKRSHSLIGLLSTICAVYLTRLRRPSWPVLIITGVLGALVVSIAIGWREAINYQRSATGFVQYLTEFHPEQILVNLNVKEEDDGVEFRSYEPFEYGGFLLMMDTVPAKSPYDYGESYLRVFSTFIPRIIWPGKPLFGRSKWIGAWIAGSEMERAEDFAGPAIGILGATQLNGGALASLIVLGLLAFAMRAAFEYVRLYPGIPWVQFFWAITYYNAWFIVVNDDPVVWFYYNWGFTAMPVIILAWWWNRDRSRPTCQPCTLIKL